MKRIRTICASLILFAASTAFGQQSQGDELTSFTWVYNGAIYGTMKAPLGYTAETVNYKEGIVTRLRYKDGSEIVLQRGGLFQVPMLNGDGFEVTKTVESEIKKIRRGNSKDAK